MENGRLGGLQCRECGRTYPIEPIHVCDFCFGPLDVTYDYPALRQTLSRRDHRARSALALALLAAPTGRAPERRRRPSRGLHPAPARAQPRQGAGLEEPLDQERQCEPSYSFKDRVVAVAIKKAREFGFATFACASTGNLAGAVAAAAAREGMAAYVSCLAIPRKQAGPCPVLWRPAVAVNGSYDDVNRLCSELADAYRWAFCNINMRPYYSEGVNRSRSR